MNIRKPISVAAAELLVSAELIPAMNLEKN